MQWADWTGGYEAIREVFVGIAIYGLLLQALLRVLRPKAEANLLLIDDHELQPKEIRDAANMAASTGEGGEDINGVALNIYKEEHEHQKESCCKGILSGRCPARSVVVFPGVSPH